MNQNIGVFHHIFYLYRIICIRILYHIYYQGLIEGSFAHPLSRYKHDISLYSFYHFILLYFKGKVCLTVSDKMGRTRCAAKRTF